LETFSTQTSFKHFQKFDWLLFSGLGDLLSGYDLVVDGRDPNSFSGLGEVDLQALADHINHKWQLIINGMKQKVKLVVRTFARMYISDNL
jgi:hypothetical protein